MTTETVMFVIGITFFAFMTLYNLKMAIKEKGNYMPAVVGFLLTSSAVLIFFKQMFYGLILFAILVVVSVIWLIKTVMKPSESLKGWDEKISKELRKKGCKEPLKFKDFFGWKGFVKIAVKYGAKKAALSVALFIVASISLIVLLVHVGFPDLIKISLGEWTFQAIIGFIFLYYISNKIFKKALKNKE